MTVNFVGYRGVVFNVAATGDTSPWNYWVDWGTSTSYGQQGCQLPQQDAGDLLQTTCNIMSLEPGTTYHARPAASDGTQTVYGSDLTFSAVAADVPSFSHFQQFQFMPAPCSCEVFFLGVSSGGYDATWQVNYGPTPALGSSTSPQIADWQVSANPGTYSEIQVDTGTLLPGTTYYFQAVGMNQVGLGASDVMSFTTGGTPPTTTPTTTTSATTPGSPAPTTTSTTLPTTTTALPPPPPPREPVAADHINGTPKADHLVGTGKADVIVAGAGNDWVNGGAGNDTLYGGSGNDTLYGGLGADRVFGGPGNDTIHTADGITDTIDCGSGRDVVYADKHDRIAKNCEVVHRS